MSILVSGIVDGRSVWQQTGNVFRSMFVVDLASVLVVGVRDKPNFHKTNVPILELRQPTRLALGGTHGPVCRGPSVRASRSHGPPAWI